MVEQKRQAVVMWEGTLDEGVGVIERSTSGALSNVSFTRASRIERPTNQMSPEELLAGAHAQCYIMGLAHVLTNAGTPPDHLIVTAECVLHLTQQGPHITDMLLHVSGRVPQLNQETFAQAARRAEALCPVSRVLREGLTICLKAHLEDETTD